jgi:hypothetical protein
LDKILLDDCLQLDDFFAPIVGFAAPAVLFVLIDPIAEYFVPIVPIAEYFVPIVPIAGLAAQTLPTVVLATLL